MGTHFKDPIVWLRGLFAALIGGATTAGGAWLGMAAAHAAGVDVPTLNFKALGIIMLSAGLVSAFAYLSKSPLPELVSEETTIITRTEVKEKQQ